ncbi:uncharacterized protein ATC70_005474 [Mucor velutinosus]|uniref:EF-hand domain-containing protein n=1 Tax=Mucor velutinosus TaxID=708070 RepID=A0AAN7HYI0_9FUNG|nr:hypothetical protein ATC70_005474 [Mucor velutinosus]
MSQPTLNALNNTQGYFSTFRTLDKNHLGYLSVAQVKDYFESQQLPQDDLIELAAHSNQGHLTPEQFVSVMNLSEMKRHGDVGYHSSKFRSLLRHCEEAMELVEKDQRANIPSSDNKDALIKAFKALEGFMKQFIQSLEDKPQGDNCSLNRSISPSTSEKMPGSFDFDHAPSHNMTPSMQTTPATAPVFLKDPSFNDIPGSPHARQNEKEPALGSPSPLPQTNDAAAFMSGGLKPVSNRNLNGDDAKPNNAHENDALRSNVLDSLRNAAMNDTEIDEDDSKEREIFSEEEPHERAVPSIPSARGMTSNAMEDVGVNSFKPSATTPSSFNNVDFKSKPRGMNTEDALAPLAASVATAFTATAAAATAAATALSDNNKNDFHPVNPTGTALSKSYVPETFQGGLGGDSSEPFIKNAKDTELKPEDQPSFGAEQARLSMQNSTDDEPVVYMDSDTAGAYSALPKSVESNQFGNESKPFEREFFQGGLGGNGTEPYIKNEKDTLLRPEDQPSFGAEQEKLRRLSERDNENESTNVLKHANEGIESSSSLGSTLSRMGAGAAGIAGATALGLSEHRDASDKSKGRSITSGSPDDASGDHLTSPRNTYSSSLTSGYNLEDASPSDIISNEALDNIADKVDADIKHNYLHDNSTTTDKDGVISSDALDKIADNVDAAMEGNAAPASTFTNVSPHEDVHVIVEQDTSLPLNIGNDVDIETTNNDNYRSPLTDKAAPPTAVSGSNDSATAYPGLNNNYTGSSSTMPVSDDRTASITNITGSRNPVLDAVNIPHTSPTSRSLNSNDITKDDSLKESPKDDSDSKDDKPGFFKRLFEITPEPASRSVPATSDEAASKDSTTSPADSKGSFTAGGAPTVDKANTFNANVPQSAVNATGDSSKLNSNTVGDMSPNVYGADASLPEINANGSSAVFPSTNESIRADLPLDDKNMESSDAFRIDNDINSPGFNANTNVGTSGLSPSLEKLSADIKNLSNNASDEFDRSVSSRGVDARLPSLHADLSGPNADMPDVDAKLDSSVKSPGVNTILSSLDTDMKSTNFEKPSLGSKSTGSAEIPEGNLPSSSAGFEGPDSDFTNTELPSFGGEHNKSISTHEIDSDVGSRGLNANVDLGDYGLSGSLDKLSAGLKDLKNEFSGKFDGSAGSSKVSSSLPSLDANLKSPSADLTNADAQLDGSMKTPGIDGKSPFFSSDMKTPFADIPNVDTPFKTSDAPAEMPSADSDSKSPSFNADGPSMETDVNASDVDSANVSGKLDRADSAPGVDGDDSDANVNTVGPSLTGALGMLSAGLKNLKDNISAKFEGSADTPDTDDELPNVDAKTSTDANLPHTDRKMSDLETPKLDSPSIDGKLTSSVDTPTPDGKLPSLDAGIESPDIDLPNVSNKLDRDISARDISARDINDDVKSPGFNADLKADASGLSGSLGKLSAGLKGLKNDTSGELDDSLESPNVNGETPSLDANFMGPSTKLPNVSDIFDSPLEVPGIDGKRPSLSFDSKAPSAELSNIDDKLDDSVNAPDFDGKLPSVNGAKSPAFDTSLNADRPDLAGSLGKLSPSFNDLKNDISANLSGETPSAGGEVPSLNANLNNPELPDVNKELPPLNTDSSTPNFDKTSLGGKMDASLSSPDIGDELPDINKELPPLSADNKTPNADLPNVNKELPSLDDNVETPKQETPSLDGKLSGSLNAPDLDRKLPSLNTDSRGPKFGLPNVSDIFDSSADLPDINAKLYSIESDLSTPNVNVDADVDASRPGLGKLSSSFEGLKDGISGKFNGSADTPHDNGELPSSDADFPDPNGKLPTLDVDMIGVKFGMPSIDGKLTNYIDPPTADAKLPALDADIHSPNVDLPTVHGKLDRSIDAPEIDSDTTPSEPNANSGMDTSGLSGSLGKLTAGLKGLKEDISGKLYGSTESPHAEGKRPILDADWNDSSASLPDVDRKLDNSIKTSDHDDKLPTLDSEFKAPHTDMPNIDSRYDGSLNADFTSSKVDHPNVSGKLDKSIDTPETDAKLPSIDDELESPRVDTDANVNAGHSSLSGALGILSSGFKELKDDITGVFGGSADTPDGNDKLSSVNTDYNSPKFGLPNTDLGLDGSVNTPETSGDLHSKDAELNAPHFKIPGDNTDLSASINTPDVDAKLPQLDTDMTAPKADVDVPDLHSPHVDAFTDGNTSTVLVAPPRKIGLSDSLENIGAGLTTPKTDVDVPQVDAHTDVPVAPPRSPRLSLNKQSSGAHLDDSTEPGNMDVGAPTDTSSGFKDPNFNVHVNGKPALESDLSTGLHRTASDRGDISADKTNDEGSSSSFSKPMEKKSGVINSFIGDGDAKMSQDDDDEARNNNNKPATGYAHLRTRSRTDSPEDLSAMLDDIVKRRFSDTPSESDINSTKTNEKANKKESVSGKSRNMDAPSSSVSACVSEPHASLNSDRPRSFVSDSRFKELDEQQAEVTEYSTPLASPVIPNTAPTNHPSSAAVGVPTVTLDKMDSLESDVKKQLDDMFVSVGQAPQVPAHEDDQLPSPSKTHRSSASLQSTSFQDRSAADAIKSVYDHMTSKLMTGGSKSGNDTDEDRVLKVRDGFENFTGFGVKCVSDNEDEEKHTAPSSTLK